MFMRTKITCMRTYTGIHARVNTYETFVHITHTFDLIACAGVVDQIQAQHEQISQQSYLIDEIHLSLSRVKGVATDAALATQQAVADLTAEDKQKSTQIEVLANQFRNARGQIANLEKFKTYALVQLQKQQKKCRKQQVLLKEQATKQALLSKQQRKFNQYFFNQLRVLKTEQKRERRSWAQQERHTHSVETSLSSLASSSVMKDGDDRKTVRNEKPLKEGDKNHRSVVDKDNGDDEGEDKHEDDSGYMDELGDLILFDEDVDEDEGGEDDKNDEEEEEDVEFEDDHAYNDKEINNEGKGHESSGGDSDASDGANCMDAQTALSRLDRMEYVFNALTPSPQASAPLPLLSIEGRSTNKQNGDSSGNPTQRSASINDDSTVLDSSKQQQQLQHHNEIGDTNNTGTSNNQNTSQIDKDISRSSNDDDHSEKSSSPIHSQTNSHNAMSTGLNHHLRPLISSQTDEIRALITETRKLSRRVHACETNIKIIDSGQGGGKSSSSSNNSIKNKAHHHNDEDKDINQTSPQSGDTACAHTAHSHAQIEKLSTSVLQKVSADLGELVAAKVQDEIQVQESLIEKVQGRVSETNTLLHQIHKYDMHACFNFS